MAVSVTLATVWLGVVLLALLLATAGLTVGRSVLAARRDRRQAAIRDRLKADLLATVSGDGPDWTARDLSETERQVLMSLIHAHVRVLKGAARDRLADVAVTHHLDETARHRIRTGTPPQQRAALHFLTALGVDIDPNDVITHCRRPMPSRVAATHALLHQPAPELDRLIDYLLGPGEALSQRGMDVLLDLATRDPTKVLRYARDNHQAWDRPLLIQGLLVIGQGFPQTIDEPLGWVVDIALPDAGFVFHGSVDVRRAAIEALRPYGWRRDLRARLDLERLLNDPSPRIRRATYRLLAAWGDTDAIEHLIAALPDEPDDRARLRGAEGLYANRPDYTPTTDRLARSWEWISAEAATEAG